MRKVYVEDLSILEEISVNDSAYIMEKDCKKAGLHFETDDMGNIYIARSTECEAYEEV